MIEDTNKIAELNSDGKIVLAIRHEDQLMFPATVDGIVWETNRQGSPAKLSFSVIQDEQLNFQEGDPVRFEYDGNKVFYGFVFIGQPTDEQKKIYEYLLAPDSRQ